MPSIIVEVGGLPVRLQADDPIFLQSLKERYAGFVAQPPAAAFDLQLNLCLESECTDDELRVAAIDGIWRIRRGDFEAECSLQSGCGWTRQGPNPYSIDTLLRILHTIILAPQGGFLLHAASAVRNGRAFVFTGVSGAGKTTISRLAPSDVTLLTDEVSYIRPEPPGYRAFGTPFAGELARPGENTSAPLSAVFLLAQGPENRRETVPPSEAAGALLRNILFFAEDPALVKQVFRSACDFVSRIPVFRLTFTPDQRVWELIA